MVMMKIQFFKKKWLINFRQVIQFTTLARFTILFPLRATPRAPPLTLCVYRKSVRCLSICMSTWIFKNHEIISIFMNNKYPIYPSHPFHSLISFIVNTIKSVLNIDLYPSTRIHCTCMKCLLRILYFIFCLQYHTNQFAIVTMISFID